MSNPAISRDLLGKIVDEVFDGAIEDASVIEEIYAAIKRYESLSPVPQTVWSKALRLVVEYDDLLRRYTGPIAGMTRSDNAAIDAAYDKMVAAARAAIEAQPAPAERLLRGDTVNKITLWFFRDIFESNRLALFSLFGLMAEDLDTLAKQQKALRHILAALAGRDGGKGE